VARAYREAGVAGRGQAEGRRDLRVRAPGFAVAAGERRRILNNTLTRCWRRRIIGIELDEDYRSAARLRRGDARGPSERYNDAHERIVVARPWRGRDRSAAGTRRFREKVALNDVSLTVPRAWCSASVAANGAGKTTLLKHVLGLYAASGGRCACSAAIRLRIRWSAVRHRLSVEDTDLPGWMRVHELLSYTRAFYPAWDDA